MHLRQIKQGKYVPMDISLCWVWILYYFKEVNMRQIEKMIQNYVK